MQTNSETYQNGQRHLSSLGDGTGSEGGGDVPAPFQEEITTPDDHAQVGSTCSTDKTCQETDSSADHLANLRLDPDMEQALQNAPHAVIAVGPRWFNDAIIGAALDHGKEQKRDIVLEYTYHDAKLVSKMSVRIMTLLPGRDTDDLSCNIEAIDLDDPNRPQYEALSYMWNEENEANPVLDEKSLRTDTIFCQGGRHLKISKNLNNFLRRTRQKDSQRVFWIDQVCINQNDEIEKAQQVKMMQYVYLRASMVLLWTGEEDEYTLLAFSLVEKLWTVILSTMDDSPSFYFDAHPRGILKSEYMSKYNLPTIDEPEWRALANFFMRKIFRRAWIIQEVVLGSLYDHTVEVLCGSHSLMLPQLLMVARFLTERRWASLLVTAYGAECRPVFIATLFGILTRIRNKEEQSLQILVASTRRWLSTRPQDKIFSLIGISCFKSGVLDEASEIPRALIPDYERPIVDMYIDATIHMIESERCLDILATIEDRRLRKIKDLPSWVPDYSVWPEISILGMPKGINYHPAGVTEVDCHLDGARTLDIKAAKIDKILFLASAWQRGDVASKKVAEWVDFIAASVPEDQAKQLSQYDPFALTLVANYNCVSDTYPVGDTLLLHYCHWFASHIIMRGSDGEAMNDTYRVAFEERGADGAIYRTALEFISYLRRLYISEQGRLGLASVSAEVGDDIVVFSGGRMPFVTRSREDGTFEVVGESYLHGIMEGQALEQDNFAWERLRLV